MITVAQWIWENAWTLITLYVVARHGRTIYRDLIFAPLAGGNGKVHMDEMAKAMILIVFVCSAFVEGTRPSGTPNVFSNEYYFALLLCVCAIAAIKPLFANMGYFKGWKEEEKTDTKKEV